MSGPLRLGVNIDHVATVRNARGGQHPDPVRAAEIAVAAGADGITAHLREDRRHITDADIDGLMAGIAVPLNLEMAATEEMVAIALRHRPHAACIVPERRQERTTEGGLDADGHREALAPMVRALGDAGIRVSLFIEPKHFRISAQAAVGRNFVMLDFLRRTNQPSIHHVWICILLHQFLPFFDQTRHRLAFVSLRFLTEFFENFVQPGNLFFRLL